MRKNSMRKLFAGVLTLAVVISGLTVVPGKVQAANEDVVKYQNVDYSDFKDCITNAKAPECTLEKDVADSEKVGYLFAGWYKTDGTPIAELDDASGETTVAAKYVPSYLTGISCQVKANVGVEGVKKTNLRIVSLVDSTNYEAVGFNVYGRDDLNGDGVVDEWLMYKYSSDSENPNKAQSTKVYSGLQVYKLDDSNNLVTDGNPKTTSDVFGADAEGFLFTTMNLSSIPDTSYDTIMAIKPYWITLDGTVVEGMGEFDRVNDSKLANGQADIVNISVNIKDATALAAGMLSVSYSTKDFTYIGVDYGRVFKEMEFNADTEKGIINCVGNVADTVVDNVSVITNNTAPNEVYVNLRFQKTPTNELAKGAAEFAVKIPEKGFCDVDEAIVTKLSVWNIKY